MRNDIPNPGSYEALKMGCTCPAVDNNYGEGAFKLNGVPQFFHNETCPLHSGMVCDYEKELDIDEEQSENDGQ